jgi:DNA-binding MarR family transcriptional regulator
LGTGGPTYPAPLSALLSQVLFRYAAEFERDSALSLTLGENVVRELDERGVDLRELPRVAAVSSEAVGMALTYLTKNGYADVVPDPTAAGAKVARLTERGRAARDAAPGLHSSVHSAWEARFGRARVALLREAADAILAQTEEGRSRLALGLEPYRDGWRASSRYLAQTEAMIADPEAGLPRYPMVLHRGGWPDGS